MDNRLKTADIDTGSVYSVSSTRFRQKPSKNASIFLNNDQKTQNKTLQSQLHEHTLVSNLRVHPLSCDNDLTSHQYIFPIAKQCQKGGKTEKARVNELLAGNALGFELANFVAAGGRRSCRFCFTPAPFELSPDGTGTV